MNNAYQVNKNHYFICILLFVPGTSSFIIYLSGTNLDWVGISQRCKTSLNEEPCSTQKDKTCSYLLDIFRLPIVIKVKYHSDFLC